ncbi:MAG: hypothetical protein K8R37_10675 [Bacteroidales bacterium]|nr:hypothetical protein [Bacteroidales bacterium]
MIESYLKSLTIQKDSNNIQEIQISPFVKSISSGVNIPFEITLHLCNPNKYMNIL